MPHTEGGGANMGLFCPKNGLIFHLAARAQPSFIWSPHTVWTPHTHTCHLLNHLVLKMSQKYSCDASTFHSARQNHLSMLGNHTLQVILPPYDYAGGQRAHLHATNNFCLTLTLLVVTYLCGRAAVLCGCVGQILCFQAETLVPEAF